MAEQFACGQVFGECAAVERHERAFAAAAVLVQVTREQFLAGAGFAVDDHTAFGIGNLPRRLQQLLHHQVLRDDGVAGLHGLDLLLERAVLALEATDIQCCTHDFTRFGQPERLGQIVICPRLHRFHRRIERGVAGDHDDRRVGGVDPHAAQHIHAVEAGHLEIGEHEIEAALRQFGECILAILAGHDVMTFALQDMREIGQGDGFVIDEQDAGSRIHAESPVE